MLKAVTLPSLWQAVPQQPHFLNLLASSIVAQPLAGATAALGDPLPEALAGSSSAQPLAGSSAAEKAPLPEFLHRWQGAQECADARAVCEDPRAYVLGRSIEEFAPAVAALTDYEEMVLSLVHPLVQVYTIPRTGQLAYVGHVCNFRQKVAKFLTSLPVLPADMPFVMVRPRLSRNRATNLPAFKVNV